MWADTLPGQKLQPDIVEMEPIEDGSAAWDSPDLTGVSKLFSSVHLEDLIDFGPREGDNIELQNALESTLTTMDEKPGPSDHLEVPSSWDTLTHGVQWLIFKVIMADGNSFVTAAVCILRLSRWQIWAFVSRYLDEWNKMREHERARSEIPRGVLLEKAAKYRLNIDQVLNLCRPRISLESIQMHDLKSGQDYLIHSGLRTYVAKVAEWRGYQDTEYPKLNITAEIAHEMVSFRTLQAAIRDGWLTQDQSQSIGKALASDDDIDHIELRGEHFSAEEIFQTFTASDVRSHGDIGLSTGAWLPPTPPHTQSTSKASTNGGLQPNLCSTPSIPTRKELLEVCRAVCTLHPDPVTRNVQASQVELQSEEVSTPETFDNAVASQAASSERPARQEKVAEPVETEAKPREDSKPSEDAAPDSSITVIPAESFTLAPQPKKIAAVQQPTPEATPEKSPEPEPSEVLRRLLDTRWAEYLDSDEEKIPGRKLKLKGPNPRKKITAVEDPDFEDTLLDVEGPEDEGDDDYVPIKKDQGKKNAPKPLKAAASLPSHSLAVKRSNNDTTASNKRRRIEQGTTPVAAAPPGQAARQDEPIFGIHRHAPLSPRKGNIDKATFAYSAEKAIFAEVAVRAQFAQYADTLLQTPHAITFRRSLLQSEQPKDTKRCKKGSSGVEGKVKELERLQRELDMMEDEHKAKNAGPARLAKLAGCADVANFAKQATEADFAMVVGGRDFVLGDEMGSA
ncbi:hypothetical protein LIA77_09036 [Sarocladium implicatum]|nr:hypothetical protein LIA77_09036 [Sarocladium implicatum]